MNFSQFFIQRPIFAAVLSLLRRGGLAGAWDGAVGPALRLAAARVRFAARPARALPREPECGWRGWRRVQGRRR